jgi:hypothetical protein
MFGLINPAEPEDGFYYDMEPTGGRYTQVNLMCNNEYPEGHIQIRNYTISGNNLTIQRPAQEFCVRLVPTPLIGNCTIDVKTTGPGGNVWELSVNLSKFTRDPPYNVSVHRVQPDLSRYNLVYSACNNTMCPSGYDCQGRADGDYLRLQAMDRQPLATL